MQTYKCRNNTWVCEIRIGAVLCICEANARKQARKGAIDMARRRAGAAA